MTDTTQILIKAAIIESAAVEARQKAVDPMMTGTGRSALYHTADAMIWAVSVLTAEPMADIRARVNAAARDIKPLREYSPVRAV